MSKPVFEDMFRWRSGRRNRKSFALLTLSQLLISILTSLGILILMPQLHQFLQGLLGLAIFVVCLGILLSHLSIMAQRIRDIGYSGYWVPVSMLPVVGPLIFVLMFIIPGSKGTNKYGPDPRNPDARADGLTSANTNASILSK